MASRLLLLLLLLSQPALGLEPAPLFDGVAINTGEPVSLADHRGRVVLVDFWASWCPPCLQSLPAYDRIYRDLGGKDFGIIAINVDEQTADGLRFQDRTPVSYPVLADPEGAIGIPWGVRSLPRSFLLDRDGRIVEVYKRFRAGDEARMKERIEALLRQ